MDLTPYIAKCREDLRGFRELDKLVHLLVMGKDICACSNPECDLTGFPDYDLLPAYSTEIAAAWQVVSHFSGRGWFLMLDQDEEGYKVSFWREGKTDLSADAICARAEEAICHAALKAVDSNGG